jgi:hypothetical protein
MLTQAGGLAEAVEEFIRGDGLFVWPKDDPTRFVSLAGKVEKRFVVLAQVFGLITRLSMAQYC